MKKKRFMEEQIIGFLREQEAVAKMGGIPLSRTPSC